MRNLVALRKPRGRPQKGALLLTVAVQQWLQGCADRGCSRKTTDSYLDHLRRLEAYASRVGAARVCDLSLEFVRGFRAWLGAEESRYGRPLAAHTQWGSFNILKMLCRWLLARGYIKADPTAGIGRPKLPKYAIPVTFQQEIHKLLLAARAQGGFLALRDEAILGVTYDGGCRSSELLGMTVGDIDWTYNRIRVLGKGSKEGYVRFTAETRRLLHRYFQSRRALMQRYGAPSGLNSALWATRHGRALTGYGLDSLYDRLRKASGVKQKFHGLRHATANALVEAGLDAFTIKEYMRHEDLATSQLYVKVFSRNLDEAVRKANPMGKLRGGHH